MGILHRFFKWRRQSGDQTSDYSPLHKAFFALPNVVIQTLNSIHRQSRQFPPFGSYSKFNYSSSALSSKRLNLLAFEMSRLDQRLSPSSNSRPLCSLCGCQRYAKLESSHQSLKSKIYDAYCFSNLIASPFLGISSPFV